MTRTHYRRRNKHGVTVASVPIPVGGLRFTRETLPAKRGTVTVWEARHDGVLIGSWSSPMGGSVGTGDHTSWYLYLRDWRAACRSEAAARADAAVHARMA